MDFSNCAASTRLSAFFQTLLNLSNFQDSIQDLHVLHVVHAVHAIMGGVHRSLLFTYYLYEYLDDSFAMRFGMWSVLAAVCDHSRTIV